MQTHWAQPVCLNVFYTAHTVGFWCAADNNININTRAIGLAQSSQPISWNYYKKKQNEASDIYLWMVLNKIKAKRKQWVIIVTDCSETKITVQCLPITSHYSNSNPM